MTAKRVPPAGTILLFAVAAGLLLRAPDLASNSVSHPEVYVPGIALPRISEPPPRLGLIDHLRWNWRSEPHPPGYYAVAWAWIQVAGSSLGAIRFPSVLFGVATIAAVFLLARELYDVRAAAIAAALLTLHGHHIWWSRMARMYALGALLAVLASWILARLERSPPSWRGRAAYLGLMWFGLCTQMYLWLLLGVHLAWTWFRARRNAWLPAATGLLGLPLVAHAILQSRRPPLDANPIVFLRDYLALGFLFRNDYDSGITPWTPDWEPWLAMAVTVAVIALRRPFRPTLCLAVALIPIPMSLLSLHVPAVADRLFLFCTPFLFIVIADGLRGRALWLAPVILVLLGRGLDFSRRTGASDFQYARVARELLPRIGPADTVLVSPHNWILSPVWFYFQGRMPHVAESASHPLDSAWVLETEWTPATPAMKKSIEGMKSVEIIRVSYARATHYRRE